MFENIFIFVLGSMVGSFLNVCIHRLPKEESIVWPGSHCPECNKPIHWYDNIPLFSYFVLAGKCRYCKARISLRYPIVELLTAIMFVLFHQRYGLGFDMFFYLVFACGLIIATFVDIKYMIIPDEISLGGIAAGLSLSAIQGISFRPLRYDFHPVTGSLLGIIIGGGIIWLVGFVFDLIYFKMLKKPAIQGETESMGGGDVKLLAMIGAFLGWENALLAFFIAPFLGIIVGLINLLVKKQHLVPYGPFLSLAALIALFWGQRIMHLFIFP